MKKPSAFDLKTTPLEKGITLVEASAGTGKTFAIAGILVRLLLETKLKIHQILVVTFTEAATKELRDRVRNRLRLALETLRKERFFDETVQPELARFLNDADDAAKAGGIRDLDEALRDFDRACIFTIHGACHRILRENAFESGLLFDLELAADAAPVIAELTADWWRKRFYHADPLIAALAHVEEFFPSAMDEFLSRRLYPRDLVLLPPLQTGGSRAVEEKLQEAFGALRSQWAQDHSPIRSIIETMKEKDSAAILPTIDELAGNREPSVELLLALKTAAGCSSKGNPAAGRTFFNGCMEFFQLTGSFFHQLRHEFRDAILSELPRLKAHRNILTYDDLLTRLADSLSRTEGVALAEAVQARYRAALIDEFQDTDSLQYNIFTKLFGTNDHHLFFIGDPKQAIYGFRGADVFTYLKARKAAEREHTLGRNWRSDDALVRAVNALFSVRAQPFLFKGISYHPAEAAGGNDREPFLMDGASPVAPLRLVYLTDRFEGKPFAAEKSREAIRRLVVAEIAGLLSGRARLGDRALGAGDIAVLVRTNEEAAGMKNLFDQHGIPAGLHVEQSVFASEEAPELARFLGAVLEPGRDALVRAVLASGLFGLSCGQIFQLETDEPQTRRWQEKFQDWRETWEQSGFIVMFRKFLLEEQVRSRLLIYRGGERRLTNLLHLSELLHQAQTERQLAPGDLLQWLLEQQEDAESCRTEEHQLRLDRDDDAVRIATIHKSKGLEYPVVFCPSHWRPAKRRHSEVIFHDPENDEKLTFDMAEDSQHLDRAVEEALAEELRLLYVAVTRARNRCYLYWGHFKDQESSALGFLLNPTPAAAPPSSKGKAKTSSSRAGAIPSTLEKLRETAKGSIEILPVDCADISVPQIRPAGSEAAPELAARKSSRVLPAASLVASFSGMIIEHHEEIQDRDVEKEQAAASDETAIAPSDGSLFSFPRGVRAGDFFHDLLEHLDFQSPSGWVHLVGTKLRAHGFDVDRFQEAITENLRNLVRLPLDGLADGPRLDAVGPCRRLSEVEFFFPLKAVNAGDLAQVFREHGGSAVSARLPRRIEDLRFCPADGFMQGVMDLVFRHQDRFYLVDWKSNWLGNRPEDYATENLLRAMEQHFYHVQYHLYLVALDLYLRDRVLDYCYERHFGGVFYVFLRGIGDERPDRGVFRDRPPVERVEALKKILMP